jgi:NDP-4-keto-2,6-dideoxyhexose 3-C-methyltransferase
MDNIWLAYLICDASDKAMQNKAMQKMHLGIERCRICGNPDLVPVLDLGEQYLTGVFPTTTSAALNKGPIHLVKCHGGDKHGGDKPEACGLVQLRHTFPAAEMYGETYGYRSGLNQSMVQHLHREVDRLRTFVDLAPQDVVLDIGSNDGTLLGHYAANGPTLVGIDPSAGKFRKYYRPDIALIVDFFSAELFRRHFGARKAKLITSIAMFYDLEDPQGFVDDVAAVLADDGLWHLEQSYLPSMLATNSFDTVCHEHITYYALRQLEWMTRRAGLRVVDVALNAVNGGSFAVTVAKEGSVFPQSDSVAATRTAEAAAGLDGLAAFEAFARRILECRETLLGFFADARRENKKIVGYGASTKGNVLLQFCGITADDLPCIAEVNEDKFGCYTPGTWIPIVSEQEARATNPDYFLVLPWHFRDAILARESDFRDRGGKLVFPLPKLEIVS